MFLTDGQTSSASLINGAPQVSAIFSSLLFSLMPTGILLVHQ